MRIFIFVILGVSSLICHSQQNEKRQSASFSLEEVAMLDIEPNAHSLTLNLGVPDFAGESVKTIMSNNSKWINFSSAVSSNSSKRNLSIKIEDGDVPAGLHLKVLTDNYSGIGKGELGTPIDVVTLNKSSQPIITNIGGAYTGNGINNGYKLTYFLEIHDYKQLDVENSEIILISLTLTDF